MTMLSIKTPSIINFNMAIFSIVASNIMTFNTTFCLMTTLIMSFNIIIHLMYLHT